MRDIIKLLRPHQYIKNLFVFALLLFSFHFVLVDVINTTIVFILFSLIASSIYILNDYMDIEEDKQHPKKKYRPLASGKVSINTAKILIVLLSSASLISAYFINVNLFISHLETNIFNV